MQNIFEKYLLTQLLEKNSTTETNFNFSLLSLFRLYFQILYNYFYFRTFMQNPVNRFFLYFYSIFLSVK